MRKERVLFVFLCCVFIVTACSQTTASEPEATQTSEEVQEAAEEKPLQEVVSKETSQGIDIDLTLMNSNMVYATVYQMVTDPERYIGKTIKMEGMYYASWYEPTQKYYHFVMIQDATACCAQGMEFIWGDGSHVYPDEYPADEALVEVIGVFETYTEDGDTNKYCRLANANLQLK